ncbi:DUF1599 domain-containing protein [Weeksella virosa]|uniref:Nucleotide modification associated domain-containing protein n=1 Tax=Weeksella virosa (strain ATCC 43766 / DSM 16922 / JCM 21250 / CCUG 30538 / CDC 9751 / IAM 14551 / NBRC 16016 / NCTC 11634 / CL345/78) TaxID=865938 RepID=F0NYS1_WEEVC|nr:DUF1599 domain-containing protein [Weeksella virosa]ADX68202.1 protein of unknown function DUF1599 [Weeksella virosa DSM 16922]MDK7674843.1 DUF1599 domain-containing protein [Weeksella virosa]SUP54515.1 Domain of Uncharacterised Function (DUF1599) [Weeksella virosa]VEH64161.1 Domain of Uncharacterised Function (DUF1599) [Weeksella virosa]
MKNTANQFQTILANCRELFQNKLQDYGSAWRVMRLPSLTDQIYIKTNRIRTLQTQDEQKIAEGEEEEFIGIINYSLISLIQLELGVVNKPDLSVEQALAYYDKMAQEAFDLMKNKNHDYGEAWRDLRISSITDLILQKILRIKQIEDNQGKTLVSEGLDANYLDMVNYSIFALILIHENKTV